METDWLQMSGHETQVGTVVEQTIQHKLQSEELLNRFDLGYARVEAEGVQRAVVDLLYAIGENPSRDGLLETPKRVANAYQELVSGYTTDPLALVNNALFDADYDDMVVVSHIEYYSLCEHHLLPFIGYAHVAYMPAGRIVGLSKIPRIVDMFARRLQVQERLTQQIAEFLDEILQPRGVAVSLSAQHMCSMMRGVKKHDPNLITNAMLGEFRQDRVLRNEFLVRTQRSENSLHF